VKKLIIIFLFIVSLFFGCSRVSDEVLLQAREAVKNGALIVDVRTPKEFKVKHIAGAINVPIAEIMKNNINLHKDKELVLYCRTGSRSSVSAKVLRKQGWKVYDVATQSDWERSVKLTR
jgi:phage shock protein E